MKLSGNLTIRKFNKHHVKEAAFVQALDDIANGRPVNAAKIFSDSGISYSQAVANSPRLAGEIDRMAEQLAKAGGISGDMARAQAELAGRMTWMVSENTGDDLVGTLAALRIEVANHLEHSPDALNMGRYQSKLDLDDFLKDALERRENKAFYNFGPVPFEALEKLKASGLGNELATGDLILPDFSVRHASNHAETLNGGHWQFVADNMREADFINIGGRPVHGGAPSFIGKISKGDKLVAFIIDIVESKKHRPHLTLMTSFEGSAKGVDNWIAQKRKQLNKQADEKASKKERAILHGSGGSPVYPSPPKDGTLPMPPSLFDNKIAPSSADVNGDILGQAIIDSSGALIRLLKGVGPEVSFHEIMHVARIFIGRMAEHQNASPELKKSWAALEKHLGVSAGDKFSQEAEEAFVDLAIKYFRDDAIVPEGLEEPLKRIRRMLAESYEATSRVGQLDLPEEVRGLFDRILAKEEEARALRDAEFFSTRPHDEDSGPMSNEEAAVAKRAEVEGYIGELEGRQELGMELTPEERAILTALEEEKLKAEVEHEKLDAALDCVIKNGGE